MENSRLNNWFRVAIIILAVFAILSLSNYPEKQLWADERLEAFTRCTEKLTDDTMILTLNESFRQGFRDCKNLSETF